MKEYLYIEFKNQSTSKRLVEQISIEEKTETFLILPERQQITLIKGEFIKREISIEKIHLQRLELIDSEGKIKTKNGISVEGYYLNIDNEQLNPYGDIVIVYREKHFPGFIIVSKPNIENLKNKLETIAVKFKNSEIDIKEASDKLKGIYSLNKLFKILKEEHKFQFDELEIITGKKLNER
jgi:hypothetical protein